MELVKAFYCLALAVWTKGGFVDLRETLSNGVFLDVPNNSSGSCFCRPQL